VSGRKTRRAEQCLTDFRKWPEQWNDAFACCSGCEKTRKALIIKAFSVLGALEQWFSDL